jgi:CYTH domain-containing protein
MAIIEKKYLLKEAISPLLQQKGVRKEPISQFYTKIEICKEVRFRKSAKRYFKTIRTGSEVRKVEVHKRIDKKSYLEAKSKKIGNVLKKDRFTLTQYHDTIAIDNYKKHLQNLRILEVSFKTLQAAEDFVLPEELKPYILHEVSDDDRYRNKNLALLGNPKKYPYNIYAIFKDIEQKRLKDISSVIFPEMIVSDAIRIILFKIYTALLNDRDALLQKSDIKALERFRRNLKEAKVLLDEYRHIFDQTMYKKVRLHLAMVEKTIAIDKDLSVIRANLKLLESAFSEKEVNSFISQIDKRIEQEKHKVKHFFKTREFSIIFRQFNLLIKEQSNVYTSYHSNTSTGEVIKRSIHKRFKKLLSLTKKYDKCHDLDSYKEMKKALHKTKVLLDNFSYLYPQKRYRKMQQLLNTTNKKFLAFIELHKRSLIIKMYIRNSNKDLQLQHKLIQKVQKKRKSLEKELNKEIDQSIAILHKEKSLFKR